MAARRPGERSAKRIAANQGAPLRWRPQFTQEPSEGIGLNGIDRYQDFLNMIALDALKCAYIKLQASRNDGQKHHRAPTLRTFLTFDRDCRSAGMLRLGFRHGASLKTGGSTKLSVTGRHPRNGQMMQCSMRFWVMELWSILLTYQNFRPQRTGGRGDRL